MISHSIFDDLMRDGKWRSVDQILRTIPDATIKDVNGWLAERLTPVDQGVRAKRYFSGRKQQRKVYIYWRVLPPSERFQSRILQFTEEELIRQHYQQVAALGRAKAEKSDG